MENEEFEPKTALGKKLYATRKRLKEAGKCNVTPEDIFINLEREMEIRMNTLYKTDFKAWLDTQITAIKTKDFAKLDTVHMLEEMETLGSSLKTAIESYLIIIMLHIIKKHIQPDYATKSWDDSIMNSQVQIAKIIDDNPSLRRYPGEVYTKCYIYAARRAAKQMKMNGESIPTSCPWSLSQILGD